MTTLNEWFQRAEGDWKSDRRYLYAGKDKFKPQMIYTDLSVRIDITDAEKRRFQMITTRDMFVLFGTAY